MQVVTDGFKDGKLEIVSDTLSGADQLAAVLNTETGQYWVVDFDGHAKLAGGMDLEMAVDLVARLRRPLDLESLTQILVDKKW
jgi:hypothetical protein